MKDHIAKCGATCNRCPSYKDYILTDADRQRASDYWFKYFGFRINPESVIPCDGCQASGKNPSLYYGGRGCNIHQCAIKNGVRTCAHCAGYRCGALKRIHKVVPNLAEKVIQLGEPVPEAFEPFMVEHPKTRLDGIRARLDPGEIVEMVRFSVSPRVAAFPDDLPFSAEVTMAFRTLHRLLAQVGHVDDVAYIDKANAQKTRHNLVKLLWSFGRYGKLKEEDGRYLTLDSETYLAQKIHSHYAYVKKYLAALGECGARAEFIPLVEAGWLTPIEVLRKHGWYLKLAFDEAIGGQLVLDALRTYVTRLDETYGKDALKRFARADMSVLCNEAS